MHDLGRDRHLHVWKKALLNSKFRQQFRLVLNRAAYNFLLTIQIPGQVYIIFDG